MRLLCTGMPEMKPVAKALLNNFHDMIHPCLHSTTREIAGWAVDGGKRISQLQSFKDGILLNAVG